MFKRWCKYARPPGRGPRKASAFRYALNGATAPVAWHVWKTVGEAQRYIEEANMIRLSDNAAAKMILAELRTKEEGQLSNPNPSLTICGSK